MACQQLQAILGDGDNLSSRLVVVSSDFKRARETAEIIHRHFKVTAPLRLETSLRERDFGDFNMTDAANYQKIWSHDAQDPNHTAFGCESVMSVFSRTSALIERLEEEYKSEERTVLLVSHGDTLQIILTRFAGVAPECHRTLDHLGNCDVRELVKSVLT